METFSLLRHIPSVKHRPLVLLVLLAALVAAPAGRAQDPPVVAEGVTIAGVAVGGLTVEQAAVAVQTAFDQPVAFVFRNRRWRVPPARLGALADVETAVDEALAAAPGEAVPLRVAIAFPRLRAHVAWLDRTLSRRPRDSRLVGLRRLRPSITRSRVGLDVRRWPTVWAIARALRRHSRGPLAPRVRILRPRVTRANYGPVVVIRRSSKWLYLYRGMAFVRRFRIAVGMPAYPTPLGRFTIVTKYRNPTWNPPDSDWARGLGPVPPGPGNPLGTRWMGLSVPGIGIHGTPQPGSIGTAASHGCIRMYIRQAEWLFERVRIGTPVFIVRA